MDAARDDLAHDFESLRPYLRSVAYRMLGSVTEADDALQECWLRLDRRHSGDAGDPIADLRSWLTVVVGRICLDQLRARRTRREDQVGTWLPEPVVQEGDEGPESAAVMADAVGIALLVVLETLSPAERLAFVLHDVFAVPFDEIAEVLDRTPAAVRQLASRGRRRVQLEAPEPDADLAVQREVVDAFLAASRDGDFDRLFAVLDPDVVLRSDFGERVVIPQLVGATAVAGYMGTEGSRFAPNGRPVIVNGGAGVAVGPPGRLTAVAGFTVVDGRIAAIDIIGDRNKLRRVTEG